MLLALPQQLLVLLVPPVQPVLLVLMVPLELLERQVPQDRLVLQELQA